MPEGESARESGSPKPRAITHDNSGTNPACGLCIRSGGTLSLEPACPFASLCFLSFVKQTG